jgi:hypothetical protein
MTPDAPNPASAAARTGSGDAVCFGGEQFLGNSASTQKYQARFSGASCPAKTAVLARTKAADHMAIRPKFNLELKD